MFHFALVSPVGVALVHGFVALVVKNMCAYTCITACAMLGCTVRAKLFLLFDIDSSPRSVRYAANGHHLTEWEHIMCFLSCTCL